MHAFARHCMCVCVCARVCNRRGAPFQIAAVPIVAAPSSDPPTTCYMPTSVEGRLQTRSRSLESECVCVCVSVTGNGFGSRGSLYETLVAVMAEVVSAVLLAILCGHFQFVSTDLSCRRRRSGPHHARDAAGGHRVRRGRWQCRMPHTGVRDLAIVSSAFDVCICARSAVMSDSGAPSRASLGEQRWSTPTQMPAKSCGTAIRCQLVLPSRPSRSVVPRIRGKRLPPLCNPHLQTSDLLTPL